MSSEQRKGLLASVICLMLLVLIWSQNSELNQVQKKIVAREGRLEEARALISKNSFLLKKSGKKSKKIEDNRPLMTIFSQALASKKMDQQIVSLTPSVDTKRKLDKVRLQLRNLKLEQAIMLSIDLKDENPNVTELEIDIQKAGTAGWNVTGTWAIPMRGSP